MENEIKNLTKSRKPRDVSERPQHLPIDIEPMQGEPTFFNFYIPHQQTIKVKFSNYKMKKKSILIISQYRKFKIKIIILIAGFNILRKFENLERKTNHHFQSR